MLDRLGARFNLRTVGAADRARAPGRDEGLAAGNKGDDFSRGGTATVSSGAARPATHPSISRRACFLCGNRPFPGQLKHTDRLRWRVSGGQEGLREHLRTLFLTGYYNFSPVVDDTLKPAFADLLDRTASAGVPFEWSGPSVRRNVAFGERRPVSVAVSVAAAGDDVHEVEARVEPAVLAKVQDKLREGLIAEPRSLRVDFACPQAIDDLLTSLAAWQSQLVEPPATPEHEARDHDRVTADVDRVSRSLHRQAVLALFDHLWPPEPRPSKKRAQARAEVEAQLRSSRPLNGRALLAAMMNVGARRKARASYDALVKMADGQPTPTLPATARLDFRPVQELELSAQLEGQFRVHAPLDAPIQSDFLATKARVELFPSAGCCLSQAALDGSAGGLETKWLDPESADPARRPPHRMISAADEPGNPSAGVRPTRAQFKGDPAGFKTAFMAYQALEFAEELKKKGVIKAEGSAGPQHTFLHESAVYYGRHDDWRPQDVFTDGIPEKERPEVFDLARHQADDPRSGLRGSCLSPETPAGFATEGGYVYVLVPVGGAVDLQILDHQAGSKQTAGAQGETELSFCSMQPCHVIAGAYPVGRRIDDQTVRHRLGPFKANPGFDKSLTDRLPAELRPFFTPA